MKSRIPKKKEVEASKQAVARDLEPCNAKAEYFQVVIKSKVWWSRCGAVLTQWR